jgi:hypothetical protein
MSGNGQRSEALFERMAKSPPAWFCLAGGLFPRRVDDVTSPVMPVNLVRDAEASYPLTQHFDGLMISPSLRGDLHLNERLARQ